MFVGVEADVGVERTETGSGVGAGKVPQQRLAASVGTLERRRITGAAEIDEHQITLPPHRSEHRGEQTGIAARPLAGSTGEHEERVRRRLSGARRQHRDVNRQPASGGVARILRHVEDAALRLLVQAVDDAGASGSVRSRAGSPQPSAATSVTTTQARFMMTLVQQRGRDLTVAGWRRKHDRAGTRDIR